VKIRDAGLAKNPCKEFDFLWNLRDKLNLEKFAEE
jgi:hypothetical protein